MRVGFDAGDRTGTIQLGEDGRVYVPTGSSQNQYLETAAPSGAAHGNAGFEDETAGIPDVWNFFFATGTTVISSEAATVYSGNRSLKVRIAAGGGEQIVLSDAFDVLAGGPVRFAALATQDEGSPTIRLGLLTGATDPTFFDLDFTNNENETADIGVTWNMYQRSAVVPVGHTRARLFYRITPAATEACTVYLDLTASSVEAPAEYDSGWLPLPFASNWSNAGFGWADCEYRRKGDDLMLRGLAARSTSSSGADAVIATLPKGFWPDTIRLVGDSYLSSASLPTASMLTINTAGQIATKASIPSGAYVALERTLPL